jgi:uncharacterized membrane protein
MTTAPAPTPYHRWMGWHAPSMRRLVTAATAGVVGGLVVAPFVTWQVAVLTGWIVTALAFLGSVGPIVLRADARHTRALAVREDLNRDTARLLLMVASTASLAAVGFALGLARHVRGGEEVLLVTVAAITVVISWTVVNMLFTLRYAHLYYREPTDGVDFAGPSGEDPDYRDFAYLAFTIGMTYQVSDTTLRDRRLRRTVLTHSLISYVFGVVIVATGVNGVAGLLS